MDLRSQVFLYYFEIEKIIYMLFKSNFMTKNAIPFLFFFRKKKEME